MNEIPDYATPALTALSAEISGAVAEMDRTLTGAVNQHPYPAVAVERAHAKQRKRAADAALAFVDALVAAHARAREDARRKKAVPLVAITGAVIGGEPAADKARDFANDYAAKEAVAKALRQQADAMLAATH